MISNVGRLYRVSGQTTKNIWIRLTQDGTIKPKDKLGAFKPPKLQQEELELIEVLKHHKPSMPYTELKRTVVISPVQEQLANQLSVDVYKAECWMESRGHGRGYLVSQQIISILKMLITVKIFSTICQYIYLYYIKSFDEAGFKLPDVSKPYYGHAPKGLPCIETGRHLDTSSVTLQLPIGLDGIVLIILVQLNFLTFSNKL